MKTAGSRNKLVLIALMAAGLAFPVQASGFLSIDADGRYLLTDFSESRVLLQAMGLSLRKVIADKRGDRWILFTQIEAMDNFHHVDFHQWYAMYKGPLGKWNISAGKFRLPYGLLTGFDSERLLFDTLEEFTVGGDRDLGLMLSGTIGAFDYAVAVTKGSGLFDSPKKGLLSGRFAVVPGTSDDLTIGFSAAYGESGDSHGMPGHGRTVRSAALDLTAYTGRGVLRAEGSYGKYNHLHQATAFINYDYRLFPNLELNAAGAMVSLNNSINHLWGFMGVTVITRIVNFKGGYQYEHKGPIRHRVSLQIYKMLSVTF